MLLVAATACRAPGRPEPLRFALIADCQYADADSAGAREYRLADGKLADCVEHLNTLELDFVVHLGDFIDRDEASFEVVGPIFGSLRAPGVHVLGNHDFSVSEEVKPLVPDLLEMPARFHEFRRGRWRFLVVDGNDLSLYAHPAGTARDLESRRYHAEEVPDAPGWNGGVGPEQLSWIDARLSAADAAGDVAILFCHFPILPDAGHNLWNAGEVRALLARHPSVAAWISGHNHAGDHAEWNGIHFWTLRAMLDTEESAYAVVTALPGRLASDGFGREPDRSLGLR